MIPVISNGLKTREQFKKKVIQILTNVPGGKKSVDLALSAEETIDEVDKKMQEKTRGANEWKLETAMIPDSVQDYFDEVVNYVITLKGKEKDEPEAPPSVSFDYCYPCDKERQSAYNRDTAAYRINFFSDHADMISKGFKVIRYFENARLSGIPYNAADAARMVPKMEQDIDYLMNEMAGRVLRAWNMYKKNAPQLPMLIELLLNTTRQFELMAKEIPEGFPDLNTIGQELISGMSKHFDEALKKRDYPVLLNIRWFIGLLRQASLMFGEFEVSENLQKFLKGNRFEMLVNTEAELGKDGQTIAVKLKGSNYYRAVPDKECKLLWHLYQPDEKMMQFTLEKAEMNMGVPANYTGTMQWETPPADIQLGFCERPVRDTLVMQNFMPKGEERWVMQGQTTPGQFVRSVLHSCFMDEKRVRAMAGDKQLQAKLQKEMMDEYNKAIAGNQELMGKDPASMTAEERDRLQKMVAATQKVQTKLTTAAAAYNVLFIESVQNNLKTVFEKEIDGRQLFPRNTSIQHAKFKVQLVHVED
jgi:hypothetical protein